MVREQMCSGNDKEMGRMRHSYSQSLIRPSLQEIIDRIFQMDFSYRNLSSSSSGSTVVVARPRLLKGNCVRVWLLTDDLSM